MENIQQQFVQLFGTELGSMLFSLTTNLALIFAIVIPLLLGVAYLTFAERKVIAYMQIRVGPNRVTFLESHGYEDGGNRLPMRLKH